VVLVVGLSIAGAVGPGTAPPRPLPASAAAAPLPAAPTPCSGLVLPTNFSGSLVVDGGPAPLPSVAGRTLTLSYYVRENYSPNGGPSTVTCQQYRQSAVTDPLGGFSVGIALPSSGCTRVSCTFYTGPLAPIQVAVGGSVPAGYFLRTSVNGPSVTASFVYALSAVALDPPGRATLSTDAPTVVRATAQAGDGSPSPATVSYDWHLVGTGWTVVAGSGSANLTIEAGSATAGLLSIWANGTFNGTAENASPVELVLDAVATAATGGSVRPTSLDVGVAARFDVIGSGAIGYPYHATIFTGVGTASVLAPCVENGTNGGTEFVDCPASVQYNSTGVVQPTAQLTNGYSFATWTFPALTVAPAPEIGVSPTPILAYVGAPATVTVVVGAGTGTAPLGPACLSSGNGRELCDLGPGPSYPFQLAWGSPGSFDAVATVSDGAGANISTNVPVQIFDRINTSWVSSGGLNPGYLGQAYNLTAEVRGGALPLQYWWNTSSSTLLSGTLDTDGTLFLPYEASTLGWTNVTLVVTDRLGTRDVVPFPALIVPGEADAVQMVRGDGFGSATAGVPYLLEWQATGTAGVVDPSYQAVETLVVTPLGPGPAAPVWVNGSAGAAGAGGSGMFPIPPSDWSSGRLFLNLSFGGAGSFALSLSGPLPVRTGSPGPEVQVGPNLQHLKLWDPLHAVGGSRGSATEYRITDAFGDNITGGYVEIVETFGSLSQANLSGVQNGPDGSTVWVNFTALSDSAGTVTVSYEGDPVSLLTLSVPAAPAPFPWLDVLLVLGASAAVASAGIAVARRRRPTDPTDLGPDEVPAATEAELRRLSEGRDHVLARADPVLGRTLDELSGGFPGRPPTPEEVTEWVASLVADGSLISELGADGRSRFRRAAPPAPAPRVELDDRALEEALRRRNEPEDDPSPGAGAPAAPDGSDR